MHIFCFIRPHLVSIEAADIDEEEEQDKDNEVIENQLVHLVTKNFLETFCMYHRIFEHFEKISEVRLKCAQFPNPSCDVHIEETRYIQC